MIRLRDSRHENTAAFLGSAIRIAEYYGFVPFEEALRASSQPGARKLIPGPKSDTEISYARREERALEKTRRNRPDLLGWDARASRSPPRATFQLVRSPKFR